MTSYKAGYVALCFTHTYNVMAPADCWSGWITADGSGQLNHGYFEGYTTIMPYSDPAAAARSGTLVAVDRESSLRRGRRRRLASSRLSVTFQRPLAPPSEFDYDITGRKTYLIWGVHATVPMCLDEATPGGACTSVGNYLQHDDGDYGAVIANLQCQGGERCILSEGLQIQAWEMVALGWFGGVAVLGLAGRVLRGRVQTFEALVQKQPLASLSPWLPSISDLGALELFIVGSYWAALVAFIVLRLDGRTDAISAAKAVGDLAAFQYGVTLLPVTRNSVWLVAMRLPFERAVRWHIWNSCGVLVSVFSHGVLFMVANRANGTVSVLGYAAFAGMLAMSCLSAPPIRRHRWEVFKAVHLALHCAVAVLSFLHAPESMLRYVMPGILLWAVDRAARLWNSAAAYREVSVAPLPGNAVRITVKAPAFALRCEPGQWAYLSLSGARGISGAEVHPFSLAPSLKPGVVSFVVQSQGKGTFTGRLRDLAMASASIPTHVGRQLSGLPNGLVARLDGPYGQLSVRLEDYDTIVLVAGGAGVVPMASVAYHLLHVFAEADAQEALEPPPRNRGSGVAREHRQHQRAAKQRPRRRPDRACFVWTSRERAALAEWFPELIQAMARSPRFDVQLYCSAFDSPDVESAPHNHRRSSAGAAGRASQASSSGVSAVGGSAVELMSLVPPSPPPTAHAGRSPSNGSPPGGRGGAGAGGLPQPPPLRGSRAAASPLEASLSLELLRGGRPDLDVVVASAIARAHASGGGRAQQPCLGELRAAVLACGPESLMAGAQVAAAKYGCAFHRETFEF